VTEHEKIPSATGDTLEQLGHELMAVQQLLDRLAVTIAVETVEHQGLIQKRMREAGISEAVARVVVHPAVPHGKALIMRRPQ
jgi:hypothetical protein